MTRSRAARAADFVTRASPFCASQNSVEAM